uniref:Uncharacterized protein n=1 Tax=Rhizophora mucronata TaxID=61149 RepID=A0A2P2IS90_RHIMU
MRAKTSRNRQFSTPKCSDTNQTFLNSSFGRTTKSPASMRQRSLSRL